MCGYRSICEVHAKTTTQRIATRTAEPPGLILRSQQRMGRSAPGYILARGLVIYFLIFFCPVQAFEFVSSSYKVRST
jgi:hypothetical protein